MTDWFVVCTQPRAERIAQMQFGKEAIETFLPLRELPPTRERPFAVEPYWPGYLFAATSVIPETVFRARKFISTEDGFPIRVPDGVVEWWQSQADKDGLIERYVPIQHRHYFKDEIVRITWGAMVGSLARVDRHKQNKIDATAYCFGRETRVQLLPEQVEPLSPGSTIPAAAAVDTPRHGRSQAPQRVA